MSEGSSSRGQSRSRSALVDVTNRIGKRGFSGREKDGVRIFNFNDKDSVKRICVSPRPCSEIRSLKGNVISGLSKIPDENREPNLCDDGDGVHCLKGINDDGRDKDKILDLDGANVVTLSVNELGVVDNDLGDGCGEAELLKNNPQRVGEVAGRNRVDPSLADLEGGKFLNPIAGEANGCSPLKENKITGTAEVANENKCWSLDFSMSDAIHSVNTGANSELGDGSHADTSRTVSETGNEFLQDDVGEENISPEGVQSDTNDRHNDLDDHNADNFVMSQSGSVDCAVLPQSQESRVLGIYKSNELKEDGCAHVTMGTNAIKACSCSFCTKAAYIWLDLHQKDIKARVSALKKSQRDASILSERSSRMKVDEKHGAENKLESHLMHQWTSLFQHMANIWEVESNQLDASLLPLNNLKDKCKAEMELMNAKLSEH